MHHSMAWVTVLTLMVLNTTLPAAENHLIQEAVIHNDSIDALCVKNQFVYTASFDGKIKKTDFIDTEIVGTHRDWVRNILCIDENIVSASNDGQIIIWHDNNIVNQVQAHSWWVTGLAFDKNRIVSVSLDETVKVWSYPDLKLLNQQKLRGSFKHHTVAISNNKAYIGSTLMLSAFDLDNYRWHFKRKSPHAGKIFLSLASTDHFVYVGDSDGKIHQFDTRNMKSHQIQSLDKSAIKALSIYNNYLYIGNDAGKIYRMKIPEFSEPVILSKYPQSVRVILAKEGVMYAGYDTGILRSFNLMK